MDEPTQPTLDFAKLRPHIVRVLQATRGGKAASAGYTDIDDLVQDVIVRAMGREGTPAAYDPSRSCWSTWVVRVADDCLRTEWRRQVTRRKLERELTYTAECLS